MTITSSKINQTMKRIFACVIVSAFLVINWNCETDPFTFPASSFIEMSKTPCFGSCPVYSVKIDGKGNVSYNGEKNVKLEGQHEMNFPPDHVNDVFKAFAEGNFWEYKEEYTDNIADLSTTYITFSHDGQTKKITDYYGAPQSLKDLEKKVENLLETLVWQE
jgi:hypothetical protein